MCEEDLESYEKAIAIDPNLDVAHVNKGQTLDKLEKYHEAIESYDRVSGDYIAYNLKGLALSSLGKLEQALESSNMAIELNEEGFDTLKKEIYCISSADLMKLLNGIKKHASQIITTRC